MIACVCICMTLSPIRGLKVTFLALQSMRARFSPNQSIPKITSKSCIHRTIRDATSYRPATITLSPLTLWVTIRYLFSDVDTVRGNCKGSSSKFADFTNPSEIKEWVALESNNVNARWSKIGSVLVTTMSVPSTFLVVIAWATARVYCVAPRPLWFFPTGLFPSWFLIWGQSATRWPDLPQPKHPPIPAKHSTLWYLLQLGHSGLLCSGALSRRSNRPRGCLSSLKEFLLGLLHWPKVFWVVTNDTFCFAICHGISINIATLRARAC